MAFLKPRPAARAPAREPGTVIGPGMVVVGDLTASGGVRIEGRVEGSIHAGEVVIGEGGEVAGEVFARTATIAGRVRGHVEALEVHVGLSAAIEGNVIHHVLTIEPGAIIKGRRPWRPRNDIEKRRPWVPS